MSRRVRGGLPPWDRGEDADLSLQDVERVLDVVVVVPGHFLLRRDLNLVDPEAGAFGVRGPPLDLVEMARLLHPFHDAPSNRNHEAPSISPRREGKPRSSLRVSRNDERLAGL